MIARDHSYPAKLFRSLRLRPLWPNHEFGRTQHKKLHFSRQFNEPQLGWSDKKPIKAFTTMHSTTGPMQLCGFCRKPFLRSCLNFNPLFTITNRRLESSYNRHVLYCRRTHGQPRIRARACQACNQAKVKCNLQARCLRCTNKNLECVYNTTEASAFTASHQAENVTQASIPALRTSDRITETFSDLYTLGGTQDLEEAQIDMDWNALDFVTDNTPLPSLKSNAPYSSESFLEHMSNEPSYGFRDDIHVVNDLNSKPDFQNLSLIEQAWSEPITPHDENLPAVCRPTHLVKQPDLDHLNPIPMLDPVSNCTANVVMQMLRAFPHMMTRRETFPPFIHGHWCYSSSPTSSALPTPLVNCMGISQVFTSHNLETRPFLWRTIQWEQRSAVEKV